MRDSCNAEMHVHVKITVLVVVKVRLSLFGFPSWRKSVLHDVGVARFVVHLSLHLAQFFVIGRL